MTTFKLAVCAAVSGALFSMPLASPAWAAEDPSHFLLTPALMEKLKMAEADMKALHQPGKEAAALAADDKNDSLDAAIGKIDKDPKTLAVLTRHGLSSRELVLSAHALFHAGMYVSTEQAMTRKKIDPYQSFTTEQKANVAVVRAFAAARKR